MKKILTSKGMLVAFLMMLFCATSFTANADCSSAVDKISEKYSRMGEAVKKCTTLEQLENINFDAVDLAPNDVPDSCLTYKLTSEDKKKLKEGFKIFYDALVNTSCRLTGDILSYSDLDEEMHYIITTHDRMTDRSTTLGNYIDNLDELDF